ncbi:MAG: hypothetical protein KBT45_01195 [Bacteroidales bacterium]|nr:hypothetical protein [Candidatus Colimorpha pelethequi]
MKKFLSNFLLAIIISSCFSQNSNLIIRHYEKCVDSFCLLDSEGANIPDAENYFINGHIVLVDKGRQQYLRMTHYPGDPMGVMSVFEIGYLFDLDSCLYYDYDGAFLTNNNVSLGELVDNIVEKQGNPTWIEEKDGCRIYCYWEDESNSEYVRENNEYAYFIKYWIKDRKLVKLKFGFEYP